MMKKFLKWLAYTGLALGLCAATGALTMVIGGAVLASAGLGILSLPTLAAVGAVGGSLILGITTPIMAWFVLDEDSKNKPKTTKGNSQEEIKEKSDQVGVYAFGLFILPFFLTLASLLVGLSGMSLLGIKGATNLGYIAAASAFGAYTAPFIIIVAAIVVASICATVYGVFLEWQDKKAEAKINAARLVGPQIRTYFLDAKDPAAAPAPAPAPAPTATATATAYPMLIAAGDAVKPDDAPAKTSTSTSTSTPAPAPANII